MPETEKDTRHAVFRDGKLIDVAADRAAALEGVKKAKAMDEKLGIKHEYRIEPW